MTHKSSNLFLAAVFLFAASLLPVSAARAAESFSPTIKIFSYSQYLNGSLGVKGSGSGTIINSAGLVLTNAHVVYDSDYEQPYDAFVVCISEDSKELPDCRFTATLKRYDEKIDLALLMIDDQPAWGSTPSPFPFLDYSHGNDAADGDEVTVRGFPANGGPTISTTKGQVSGYADVDGHEYLKTDADIDAGNSGGTMLDSQGNFVGVPSYLVSYYENSGRALKISEVAAWIDSNDGELGIRNAGAREKARAIWQSYHETSTNREFVSKQDPKVRMIVPSGWIVLDVSPVGVAIMKEDNQSASFTLSISSNIFDLKMTKEEREEAFEKIMGDDAYDESEFIKVGGHDALHLYSEVSGGSNHVVSLSHGYKDINITYSVPDADKEVVEKDVEAIFKSMTFASPDADDPNPVTRIDEPAYSFSIEAPEDWRATIDDITGKTLAYLTRATKTIESLKVYYSKIYNEIDYTMEEGLEYDLMHYVMFGGDVVFENDELMLDGLPGWIYIYEKEEDNADYKYASVTVVDPEYEIYFDFKAEKSEFDAQLPAFVEMLKSFQTKRFDDYNPDWDKELFDPANKGTYRVPHPGDSDSELNDIKGHRFEDSIKELVKMEVISGYPDGSFKPENPVNRAEALKIILQSLRAEQEEDGEESFEMPEDFNEFSDLKPTEWYATYVAEGVEKEIISGYPDGTFKGGNTVNLAEALKMALIAHDVTIWTGETDPWHKKYFDAAYALGILPTALNDPAHLLTRAELVYIVDQLVSH